MIWWWRGFPKSCGKVCNEYLRIVEAGKRAADHYNEDGITALQLIINLDDRFAFAFPLPAFRNGRRSLTQGYFPVDRYL